MRRLANRNITLLFLIKISKWFMLYMPVVKLFYAENQLDDFDLFLLHAIYSGVIFLTEVPSGYFADVWGRKSSIQLGLFLGFAGFSIYSFTGGFWGFLLAELALGIGQGFISGSDSALLYDSLYQEKKENSYLKYEGRISGSGNIAEGMAGVLVSLLAFSTIRNYYYIQSALAFIGFMLSWWLVEPRLHARKNKISFRNILEIVRHTLWTHKQLSRFVLFSSVIGFASLSMAWFAQIFIYDAGVPHHLFGYIWTLLNGMVALGSFSANWLDSKLGPRFSLLYILFFLAGGYFLASQTIAPYGIVFLLLFYYVRGTAHPILKERINRLTTSDVRATVLSVRSLIIRISFAALGPILGYLTEKISLSFSLLMTGCTVLLPGIFLLVLLLPKAGRTHAHENS